MFNAPILIREGRAGGIQAALFFDKLRQLSGGIFKKFLMTMDAQMMVSYKRQPFVRSSEDVHQIFDNRLISPGFTKFRYGWWATEKVSSDDYDAYMSMVSVSSFSYHHPLPLSFVRCAGNLLLRC